MTQSQCHAGSGSHPNTMDEGDVVSPKPACDLDPSAERRGLRGNNMGGGFFSAGHEQAECDCVNWLNVR